MLPCWLGARRASIEAFAKSAAQARLLKGSALIVGAGGLGSPAALYLAAAGVGRIGIIDQDVVELSNLHRQIIHNEARVGIHKAESAKQACTGLNSSIQVVGLHTVVPTHVHRSSYQLVQADCLQWFMTTRQCLHLSSLPLNTGTSVCTLSRLLGIHIAAIATKAYKDTV